MNAGTSSSTTSKKFFLKSFLNGPRECVRLFMHFLHEVTWPHYKTRSAASRCRRTDSLRQAPPSDKTGDRCGEEMTWVRGGRLWIIHGPPQAASLGRIPEASAEYFTWKVNAHPCLSLARNCMPTWIGHRCKSQTMQLKSARRSARKFQAISNGLVNHNEQNGGGDGLLTRM